jgi:ribosome biogenesis GTPase A
MTDLSRAIAVKPIITYPSEAQVGKTYLMTIDLQPEENFEWQYDEEEYPIYCTVDSNLFSSKPVGEPVVVLHRFGGSYGEAKFLLTATDEVTEGEVSITLVNAWGLSIKTIKVLSSLRAIQNVIPEKEVTNKQAQILDTSSLADALIAIIRQQSAILQSLNMSEWEDNLHQLEEQTLSEGFKILFLGEFKRGKSTLINALLAREVNHEILATDVLPTTASITQIKWGETPHVILHYSNEQSMLVSVEQLKDYVAINHTDIIADESFCERIEVFLPISFLKSGLEIIDSPGLNDTEIRQRITLNYLTRSDLVFFVLSALAPLSQSELEIIERIININRDIIFICNQFDRVPDKDKDRFKAYVTNRLAHLNKGGKKKIFFVSAYEALHGRLLGNSNQVQKSGIILLEQEIDKLIISRRELRFHRISAVVKESIRESRHAIFVQSSLVQSEQADLDVRYRRETDRLEIINEVSSKLDRRISRSREEIMSLVSAKASQPFNQVARQIDNWVEGYEVREPLAFKDFLPGNNTSAVRRVASEVTEHLISRMDIEFTQWQSTELQPSISQYLESISHDLESISHELSAIQIELDSQLNFNRNIFLVEASLSRSNVVGLQMLPVTAGLATISAIANPELLAIGTIVGMISLTTEKIKKAVASRLKYELLSLSYEISQQLAITVADTISAEIRNAVHQKFARELEYSYEEGVSLRQKMEERTRQFEESKVYLHRLSSQLDSIEQQLENLEEQLHKLKSIGTVLDER